MKVMAADPARAEALIRAALVMAPDRGDAKLLLSEALRRMGDLDAARALAAPLAAADKSWFGAQRQLGVILAEQGEPLAAAVALAAAAEISPEHPTIWRDLASQLALAGDEAGARAAMARHAAAPVLEPAMLRAARALSEQEPDLALEILSKHLAQYPDDVSALRFLSEAHARLNRPDLAEAALRRCLELAPDFLYARHALAQLLMGLGRAEEALGEARNLLARDPANKGSRRLLAAVEVALGDFDAALATYESLLEEDPKQARVWMSYGHALKTVGRTPDGVNAYRQSIALSPGLGESYWSLANLKTVRLTDDDVARMLAQLQRADLTLQDRVGMLYALGKAYEDAGRIEDSFARYAEGAALYRASVGYDPEQMARFVARSRELFTPNFFAQRTGAGDPAPDAIFIVGMPRAGSTLVEQILASHSKVEGTMELPDLPSIAQAMVGYERAGRGESYLDAIAGIDAGAFAALGAAYLRTTRVQRKTARPLFIDKLPNNFLHVGLIQLILPNAIVIDARRNPMACCFSCFKQHFAQGQLFSYGLDDLGRFYADYVRLMAHYDAVLPGRVYRVIHERLAADPETEIRRLLAHCKLDVEDACLRPHETQRAVRTASSEQVRRPISAAGLDEWRAFDAHLEPLKAALGPVLDAYPDAPPL